MLFSVYMSHLFTFEKIILFFEELLRKLVCCFILFSSPEPKAHGGAYSIPVTPGSVHQHQTSSPLKPLGQLNSNFIWRLLRKVCSNGPGHMTKMAAMPIYGKNPLKKLLFQNQKADDLGT